jgi:acetyltransferase-like isoleucine patch superfamily enzyme
MYKKILRLIELLLPEILVSKVKYRKLIKNKCAIGPNVEIIKSTIGHSVRFAHNASIRNCIVNDFTSIGRYTKVNYAHIGKYCSISWDITIGAVNHPSNTLSTHAFPYVKRIGFVEEDNQHHENTLIGNDVWIGCNSVILPGVKVGDGAIIGSGSVVTKDVPEYAIMAGVPAKIIRYRFEEEVRNKLRELEWWHLPSQIIKQNIEIFQSPLDENALEKLANLKGNKKTLK